jgi:membrane protease YdiL (CAAX protease family)
VRSFGKTIDLIIVLLVVRILPEIARLATNYAFPFVKSLDPAGTYLWISIHHIFQLILTVLLMITWFKSPLKSLGFNFRELNLSVNIFGWVSLGFIVLAFLTNAIPYLVSGEAPSFHYPLNARNMGSVLGFQILLSGTCEEPLFRGFVMIALARSWKGSLCLWKLEIPVAGLWATLFFMFAHIGISVNPLGISNFSIPQQILSLFLGLFYAILFHRTKSLFGPMVYHGYSNVILIGVLYLLAFAMS